MACAFPAAAIAPTHTFSLSLSPPLIVIDAHVQTSHLAFHRQMPFRFAHIYGTATGGSPTFYVGATDSLCSRQRASRSKPAPATVLLLLVGCKIMAVNLWAQSCFSPNLVIQKASVSLSPVCSMFMQNNTK
nr:hypothetical protein Iba_chr12aCG20520 [Ipomoea batatas]